MRPPNENGQGLVEYGMVILLVAVIVAALVVVFGASVGNLYSNIISAF